MVQEVPQHNKIQTKSTSTGKHTDMVQAVSQQTRIHPKATSHGKQTDMGQVTPQPTVTHKKFHSDPQHTSNLAMSSMNDKQLALIQDSLFTQPKSKRNGKQSVMTQGAQSNHKEDYVPINVSEPIPVSVSKPVDLLENHSK